MNNFSRLGLHECIVKACHEVGYQNPTPIQEEAIPPALKGRDVIGIAETGSGKTGAFVLPILNNLLSAPCDYHSLILSPTRELAIQIAHNFDAIGSKINLRSVTLVGGMDIVQQSISLSKRPHVIIGTPGRICDHLESTKGFNVKNIKFLVLDEADRLLGLDFDKELDIIMGCCPRERTTLLFSATMTEKLSKLQRVCLTRPVRVSVNPKFSSVPTLESFYVFVPAKEKDLHLVHILNELGSIQSIIFARSCESTLRIALFLRNLGFSAIPIHGQMSQTKRVKALSLFKAGERKIMVATDLASRGLDIPSINAVLNYDVPSNPKDYVHRVGRTARAGKTGSAITLVTQYDVELYQQIEKALRQKFAKYSLNEEILKFLRERVADASRVAKFQMQESTNKKFRSNCTSKFNL